jgi:prephenate dehydrogenase
VNLESVLAGSQVVILALPVLTIVECLPEVARYAPHDAVIIDTGSVKVPVVAAMMAVPHPERAIGGHPMAGREVAGPASASPDLFSGKKFVLCPTPGMDQGTMEVAKGLVRQLGAIPLELDAAEHDRMAARTSHFPQVLSTLLALTTEPKEKPLLGTAFRDMSRLAASDPHIWRDIILANRREICRAAREFAARLDQIIEAMEASDGASVESILEAGKGRAAILREGYAA